MFARLAYTLHFTKVDNENNVAHSFTYLVCLPNSKEEVGNSTGNEAQLNTFQGQDDWATSILDQATMDTSLKSSQAFGNLFTLLPSSINNPLSSAVIESTKAVL
jgi:hypothetical protein